MRKLRQEVQGFARGHTVAELGFRPAGSCSNGHSGKSSCPGGVGVGSLGHLAPAPTVEGRADLPLVIPLLIAEGGPGARSTTSSSESGCLWHFIISNHFAGAACFLLSALLEMMYGDEMVQLLPSPAIQLSCCRQQIPHLMCSLMGMQELKGGQLSVTYPGIHLKSSPERDLPWGRQG